MRIPGIFMQTVLLFLMLLPNTHVISQSKNSVGAMIGCSIPVGKFGSENTSDGQTGFAKTGFAASLRYARTIKKSFSVAVDVRTRSNSFNMDPLVESYKRSYPYSTWEKNNPAWKCFALMVGTENDFRLSTSFSIALSIIAGVAKTEMPELSITGGDVSSTIAYKRTSGSANSFSTSIGTIFKNRLGKKVLLSLTGDYWYVKPTFKKVTESYFMQSGNMVTAINFTNSYSINTSTINVTAGFIFEL